MPTGSLCAERNVIGTALATNPRLRREDLMMVAVLAIPLTDGSSSLASPTRLPSPPPGIDLTKCTFINNAKAASEAPREESSTFFSEVKERLAQFQRPETIPSRSVSIGSFASIVEGSDSHETDESWEKMPSTEKIELCPSNANIRDKLAPNNDDNPSGIGTPVRKIKLFEDKDILDNVTKTSNQGIFRQKKKRSVIVHSSEVRQSCVHMYL